MADYFTQLAFEIELQSESLAIAAHEFFDLWQNAIDGDIEGDEWPESIPHATGDYCDTGIDVSREFKTLRITDGDGHANVDFVLDFVQEVLKRFNPSADTAFEWANTCSRANSNGFGGGAAIVTADDRNAVSTRSKTRNSRRGWICGASGGRAASSVKHRSSSGAQTNRGDSGLARP